jgi:hypothetical protein
MMLSSVAVKTVPAGTTPMPLVMFKVGALSRSTGSMRSNTAAALDAAHPTAPWHSNRRLNLDRLPAAVCPKLAGR